MQGRSLELHAINRHGFLHQYAQVKVEGATHMPSSGALSNPNDKICVKALEDRMIEAYGKAIVVAKCEEGIVVDLSSKMLRMVHVETLGAAIDEFKVVSLNLQRNQLGTGGAAALAGFLESNTSLKMLRCAHHIFYLLWT